MTAEIYHIYCALQIVTFITMVLVFVSNIDFFFLVLHTMMLGVKILLYAYFHDWFGVITMVFPFILWVLLTKYIYHKYVNKGISLVFTLRTSYSYPPALPMDREVLSYTKIAVNRFVFNIDRLKLLICVYFIADKQRKHKAYDDMCSFRYPDCFILQKPYYFDTMPAYYRKKSDMTAGDDIEAAANKNMSKRSFLSPSFMYLRGVLPKKERLEWHWLHNLNRTKAEFEQWWTIQDLEFKTKG